MTNRGRGQNRVDTIALILKAKFKNVHAVHASRNTYVCARARARSIHPSENTWTLWTNQELFNENNINSCPQIDFRTVDMSTKSVDKMMIYVH